MGNSKEGSRFINPYNFVPLSGECDKQKRQAGNLTGKIECTIETLTPTFIPMREPKENGEEAPEFFHYPQDPRPVIPGSEIRGAIRSVFEAAYNGCLSQINKKAFHRRSMEPKKPGLLYRSDGKWLLEKCERIMLNAPRKGGATSHQGKYINRDSIKTGRKIYIKRSHQRYQSSRQKYGKNIEMPYVVADYSYEYQEGYEEGVVCLGNSFGKKKHHESVFVRLKGNQVDGKNLMLEVVDEELIKGLEEVLDLYQSNDKKSEKSYVDKKELLGSGKVEKKLPVYYSEDDKGGILHLAPAIFSQEVFQNTLQDILEEQGDHALCTCKDRLCPACHLFGFVTENELQASRIRFSDGMAAEQEVSMADKITLPALGQPKPGAVEFYTEYLRVNRPSGNYNYWTYDYQKQGNRRYRLTPNELKIRGRKFYWHHKPVKYKLKSEIKDNMERTIKPVGTGQEFKFTVYFERITEKELAQLCNVLDINGSDKHAHKIGRAKPFGFGSIRIKICNIIIRKINEYTGEINLEKTSREEWRNYRIKNDELLTILNSKTFMNSDQISYPKVESSKNSENLNDSASHQWFNKNNDKKSHINNVLPTISEEVSNNQHKWLKVKKV